MIRRIAAGLLVAAMWSVLATTPAHAYAQWKSRIDKAIGARSMGVAVRFQSRDVYRHADRMRRTPASNEKLLLSMALLDRMVPGARLPTIAATRSVDGHVIEGNLWILGRGDPTVTDGGRIARSLPMKPTRVGKLARRIKGAGIRKVEGNVIGSTGYFARDWYAPGWKPSFPAEEVALPSALTFDGNTADGKHIFDPEKRAAKALAKRLRGIGVRVLGEPAAGKPPKRLDVVAQVTSPPLKTMMGYMNRTSSNFFAEVLGKRLAVEVHGPPGTIDKAGRSIAGLAARVGVKIVAEDSSGLSYSDRISPHGMVTLLDFADGQTWGRALMGTLAKADQGTLDDRLYGVKLRAKTGTLDGISTLSGWVWLDKVDRWACFSIMSQGMSKSIAAGIEDRILRILHTSAHPAAKKPSGRSSAERGGEDTAAFDDHALIAVDEQDDAGSAPNAGFLSLFF